MSEPPGTRDDHREAAHRAAAEHLLATSFVDRVEYRFEATSTNDVARELAAALPKSETLLVVTERQTAGRGRGANRWWTGGQSIACSVLLHPAGRGIAVQHGPLVALAAALAIIEAARPRLPADAPLGLHWPNDVFLGHRKLAGILVEALPDGRQIVGIGCNVNDRFDAAPDDVRRRATSLLEETGREYDRLELLGKVLSALDAGLTQLAADSRQLGRAAHRHCLQLGETLTLQHGPQRIIGRCLGIADDGALLLDTASGPRAFYAGALVHEPEPRP